MTIRELILSRYTALKNKKEEDFFMRFLLLILMFVFASIGFGAGIPNNNVKIGTDTSIIKGFEFNFGGDNPKLQVDTDKSLNFDRDLFSIGTGAASGDKKITFNGYNYSIGIDGATGKLGFDNGNGIKAFGTGSGGGGDNFNNAFTSDDNAGAENGTDKWTASGGTLTLESAEGTPDPLVGENSLLWTPAAQNDTLTHDAISLDKDIFKGKACEVSILYVGGDENLTLQIVDGNNDVIASQVLQTHTISSHESAFFLCPSASDIAGDENKGSVRFRVINSGAIASALVKVDSAYIGTLKGLSESTLPDICTFTVNMVADSIGSVGESCPTGMTVTGSIGNAIISIPSGFYSVTPQMHITGSNQGGNGLYCYDPIASTGASPTLRAFRCADGSGTLSDSSFVQVSLIKKGADAKQSVQVYKSIPKVSENINTFSAYATTSGAVSRENADFIDGDFVESPTGHYSATFVAGTFLEYPNCQVTAVSTGSEAIIKGIGPTVLVVDTKNSAGTLVSSAFSIACHKHSTDFKMPTVQPIVIPNAVFYGPYDLTVSGTGWTTIRATAIFKYVNGTWRMEGNIVGGTSTIGSSSITISGIVSPTNQEVSTRVGSLREYGASILSSGSGTIVIYTDPGGSLSNVKLSLNVELSSKPTLYVP